MDQFLSNLSQHKPINTTKDNHIVSQLLLRKFWNNNNASLYWNKAGINKMPILTKGKYKFKEIFSLQENLNDKTEDFLAEVENKMSVLLNKIILEKLNQVLIKGNEETVNFSDLILSNEQEDIFIIFFISIYYRNILAKKTKNIIKDVQDPLIQNELIKEIIEDIEALDCNLTENELERFNIQKNIITAANSQRLEQQFNEEYLLNNINSNNFIFRILKTTIIESKFIIYPDNKVVISNEFYIQNLDYILPITKNILLYYTTDNIIKDGNIIKKYTDYILNKGDEFLFYNKRLKSSLIK